MKRGIEATMKETDLLLVQKTSVLLNFHSCAIGVDVERQILLVLMELQLLTAETTDKKGESGQKGNRLDNSD